MMPSVSNELFGKSTRWYVDQAEWSWFGLVLVISAVYLGSFWLEVSYLTLMAPLVLILQVTIIAATSYLVGVRRQSSLAQTTTVCALVAFGGGAAAAVWAVIRFWHPWLFLNLVTEPVWSALLAVLVSAATIGFFRLPALINRLRVIFQPED